MPSSQALSTLAQVLPALIQALTALGPTLAAGTRQPGTPATEAGEESFASSSYNTAQAKETMESEQVYSPIGYSPEEMYLMQEEAVLSIGRT
jgi:hypothetical protein